tara:strand:- start:340 stop:831 length:492 start_codon:yes stop_codon:yes gene_type:complete
MNNNTKKDKNTNDQLLGPDRLPLNFHIEKENGLSTTDARVKAICKVADVEPLEAVELLTNEDWLCLTDNEADELARQLILDSVWAFTPWFLSKQTGIDEEIFKLLQEKCEGANDAILRMIKDIDSFVNDAIGCDGRGHFISHWDGNEHEITIDNIDFFCFQLN